MSTHTININGIDVVYDKEGSGPPLLFLHGGTSCAVWAEHLVPQFMGDHTCFVLEQRGHGRSGRSPTCDYGIASLVNDCIQFMDLVSGPAITVGWSQGGAIAMGVAAERPDLVRAIFLEDSVPALYGEREHVGLGALDFFGAIGPLAELKEREQLTLAAHTFNLGQLKLGDFRLADIMPPEQLAFFARHAYPTDPAWYRFVAERRFPWPDSVCDSIPAKVSCPVHVAYGDKLSGGIVEAGHLENLRQQGVNLTATHYPGAGHGIGFAFARQYVADLRAFLAGLPA